MKLLDKTHYDSVLDRVSGIPFNTLFALTVLRSKVEGKVYVDDLVDPGTFYIAHPYGMSLLCGSTESTEFNRHPHHRL